MPYCPECGGDLHYDPSIRRYTCKSCGLSLSYQEIMELKEKLRPNFENKDEQRKKKRKDYLDWWFSRKRR